MMKRLVLKDILDEAMYDEYNKLVEEWHPEVIYSTEERAKLRLYNDILMDIYRFNVTMELYK